MKIVEQMTNAIHNKIGNEVERVQIPRVERLQKILSMDPIERSNDDLANVAELFKDVKFF